MSRESTYDAIADNRVSVALGTQFDPPIPGGSQLMRAAANPATSRSPGAQSIVWVRDGVVIAENGGGTADPRYQLDVISWTTDLTISDFQASDAGVYQIIFTDTAASGSEVLTTTPVQLDTGEHMSI